MDESNAMKQHGAFWLREWDEEHRTETHVPYSVLDRLFKPVGFIMDARMSACFYAYADRGSCRTFRYRPNDRGQKLEAALGFVTESIAP